MQANDGLTLEDSVTFLRQTLVPGGYQPCSFKVDTPENFTDKLKSLVATYRFRHCVKELKQQGVDFSTYLYIPEVDPITGDVYHEREDHCHILKRIWKHTREGNMHLIIIHVVCMDINESKSTCMLFWCTESFNYKKKLDNPAAPKQFH